MVDVTELMDIAKKLKFKPELVQILYLTHTEFHALLWHGLIKDTPLDIEARFDELARHHVLNARRKEQEAPSILEIVNV